MAAATGIRRRKRRAKTFDCGVGAEDPGYDFAESPRRRKHPLDRTDVSPAPGGAARTIVHPVWHRHDVQPHRVERFKVSKIHGSRKRCRYRRSIPELSRPRPGVVLGREKPNSGAGPHSPRNFPSGTAANPPLLTGTVNQRVVFRETSEEPGGVAKLSDLVVVSGKCQGKDLPGELAPDETPLASGVGSKPALRES